jgi:predicted acetyltransferase
LTRILGLALERARDLGIWKVLVTCDADNIGSRKIIEANGGRLENEVQVPNSTVRKLRFWIANDGDEGETVS